MLGGLCPEILCAVLEGGHYKIQLCRIVLALINDHETDFLG